MSLKNIIQTTSKLTIGSIFSALIMTLVISVMLIDYQLSDSVKDNVGTLSTVGSFLISGVAIWIALRNEHNQYRAKKELFKQTLIGVVQDLRGRIVPIRRNAGVIKHHFMMYKNHVDCIDKAKDEYDALRSGNAKLQQQLVCNDNGVFSPEQREELEESRRREGEVEKRIKQYSQQLTAILRRYREEFLALNFYLDIAPPEIIKELKQQSVHLGKEKELKERLQRLEECLDYAFVVLGSEHIVATRWREVKVDLITHPSTRLTPFLHKEMYEEVLTITKSIDDQLIEIIKNLATT